MSLRKKIIILIGVISLVFFGLGIQMIEASLSGEQICLELNGDEKCRQIYSNTNTCTGQQIKGCFATDRIAAECLLERRDGMRVCVCNRRRTEYVNCANLGYTACREGECVNPRQPRHPDYPPITPITPITPPTSLVCPGQPCPPGAICIQNPLCAKSFEELINAIINFIFWVAVALAPLLIIIAGFYFLIAAGDPAKIQIAKNIILYTCIGLFIILFAKGLIAVIQSVLGVK